MNVILGPYFDNIIARVLKSGRAASQTEVIRQALIDYDRRLSAEDRAFVRAMDADMADIRSGKSKLIPAEDVAKELGLPWPRSLSKTKRVTSSKR